MALRTETIQAVVIADYDQTPQVEWVELEDPGPGEVRVRIHAAGVCHSDWHAVTGTLPLPMPMVLGHEASGTVTQVGSDVARVAVGDRVVVTWVPVCGHCFWCLNGAPELCEAANRGAVDGTGADGHTPLRWRGQPLHRFSWSGTLATAAVVPESAVVRIGPDMPWRDAALLGCAVQTGVGAALRAPIVPGDTVAVLGLGGVGQNVVQGARIAGAARIIGVDPIDWKRDLARELGATDTVDASEDVLTALLDLTDGRGVDVAFEAVGHVPLMALAFNAVRRGGTAVMVGVPEPNAEVSLNAFAFPSQEKTLTGSWLGGSHPARDIPRLEALWRSGQLKLAPLTSHTYALHEVPKALNDLLTGRVARPVVVFSDAEAPATRAPTSVPGQVGEE
ncbi:MAG: Zn-dependent alcohol dehydrogenase [Thermaerobacter sp.]|nr:Zn-dependent alcohol dehydrogenase [Thermaerobacter sp.]